MMYMYNWDSNPNVIEYLNKLYKNTLSYLTENNYDAEYANEFIYDVEDFIYYFKINKYNVNNILSKISDIECIEFYDSFFTSNRVNDNSEVPPVMNRGSKLLLNVDIAGNKRLSSKERRRMYLYVGLAHSILSFKSTNTLMLAKLYSRYLSSNEAMTESIVNNGWQLLEDTLAQEIAEKITYVTIGKVRPGYRPGLDGEEYPISGHQVSSNLEDYRVFQEILVRFGLTISKIGNLFDYSNNSIINDLIDCSINHRLSNVIINDYCDRKNSFKLYQLLYLMGILLNEKYRVYHMNYIRNNKLSVEEVDRIYGSIHDFTDELVNFDDNAVNDKDNGNIVSLYDPEIREKIKKLVMHNEI